MAEHGALALTVYYAGVSIGRFVSGLLVWHKSISRFTCCTVCYYVCWPEALYKSIKKARQI